MTKGGNISVSTLWQMSISSIEGQYRQPELLVLSNLAGQVLCLLFLLRRPRAFWGISP